MATRRTYDDPYAYQDPNADPNGEGDNPLASLDVSGIPSQPDVSNTSARDQSNANPSPDPAPPPVGNINREGFKNDWQSTSGTMDEFLKSHPQYQGQVTPHNGSKDVYDLKGTNESLDLLQDQGGMNGHAWMGTGVGQNGVMDKPANGPNSPSGAPNGLPPAFGSLSDYVGSQGQPSPSGGGSKDLSSLSTILQGLMTSGGGFSQSLVDRRTDNARDSMQKSLKSRQATDRAILADRGTLGSGPELTAMNRAGEAEQNDLENAVSGIYADESGNADNRLIQALQIAAGMSEADATNAINWFRSQSDKSLGEGNLALGNKQADNSYQLGLGDLALGDRQASNSYNLGAGNLQLGYDQLNSNNDNQSLQDLIDILTGRITTTGQANQGYQG